MTENQDQAVQDRYSKGAREREPALCCPVQYDPTYLKKIPKEIVERDYGCGDPTPYLLEGDVVLDLGSGTGKVCYIAAQKVGARGQVIGLDLNNDMLALSRKHIDSFAKEIGYKNIRFLKAQIQDLASNLEELEQYLQNHSIRSTDEYFKFQQFIDRQKRERPLIANASVDCVVSNCVLNLVNEQDKPLLFREMFRVLKKGGRIAISDIVADEPVPEELKKDAKLWSGCISGAMTETGFLRAFEEAGFYGICLEKRETKPWQTVQGYEFRSVVVTAKKGKEGPCWDRHQAVIYRGPFKEVTDDDGHTYLRGARMSVCEKTFQILAKEPYKESFSPVEPLKEVSLKDARAFDCHIPKIRSPRVTKGESYRETSDASDSCPPNDGASPGSCC